MQKQILNPNLRVALDIDSTILDFDSAFNSYYNCDLYNMESKDITEKVNKLRLNKKFWSNLELLERPDFEPYIYATKRVNLKSYTRANLKKLGLPIKPIYQIYSQEDNKARIIKGHCDVLIDDSWFNVQQALKSGLPALLITRPHNKHIDTKYRVDRLNYKEIECKYNELFRM